MLNFYTGVIRPVLEYAAPVWNHLLTKAQIDQLEAIQRRALGIIYSYTNDMPYINALYCAAIHSLADRREQLSRKFFKSVQEPSSCLSSLLPTHGIPPLQLDYESQTNFLSYPAVRKKISDIYFLGSVSLTDIIAIQPSILLFCSFFLISSTSVWL